MKLTGAVRSALVLLCSIVSVQGAFILTATPSQAQWWKGHFGCLFTEDRDRRGKQWVVDDGYQYYKLGRWNDQISAIVCTAYCKTTVYEHPGYDGRSMTTEAASFEGNFWNDRISSLKVFCEK